ncbi:Mannosylglucosyl-3-phosphoglycerate phosphatase [Olavius sp. associated proteobacterium Delta 1]|nr:Mannosylglucosyl-3-phosphoglycerate phosphatase [Olavius sp. associated proteobacterium Delta 1]
MIEKKSIQNYIRRLKPIPTSFAPAGDLTHDIRCVLFDIYGTLFVSGSGDISLAEQDSPQMEEIKFLLAKHEIQKSPRVLLDELHGAVKARHLELHLKGIDFPEVKIDRIWRQVLQPKDQDSVRQFAAEFELISNPVYPMPNLADLLSTCRQKGLLMGIISNAQFYTPYLFNWFLDSDPVGLGFSPDLIFYSYCFEMAKPTVALFKMAADKLKEKQIQPASVLYIGNDMLNDIYPAQKSGFQTALFAGDGRSLRLRTDDPRCRRLTPDLIVTDLSQLIRHIQSKPEKTNHAEDVI